MIKYVQGNFFDYEADIRVNTVNCVGVMGAGAALQFKKKYPSMYKEYVKECQQGRVQIGKPHVWSENEMFNENNITIISFPTKKHWKNPSEYSFIEAGLEWLRDYLVNNPNRTITLPALGCGHGGLDWSRVKVMIERYLMDSPAQILVFEPYSSTRVDEEQVSEEYLNKENISLILPHDQGYPGKLRGRSADKIYLKGDKSIFHRKLLSIIVDSKADDREKEAVLKCVDVLTKENFVYFLGYNSSFEIDLVKALLEKKSKILISLPYGISKLKIRKDLQPFWNEDLITLVSLDAPNQTWKINQSINALKFRIKLSDAILIANQELKSIRKFENEFSESGSFIFYINYWNDTKDFYNRISARKIGRNRNTYAPNISPILQSLRV